MSATVQSGVEGDCVVTLREKFNTSLMDLVNSKSDNSNLFSEEKYAQLIKEVKEVKHKQRKEC
jgi:predicted metal-dependent enzyme (double-stranded beta helix superfamily)